MNCTAIVLVGRPVSETKPAKGLFMLQRKPLVLWTAEALSKVCDEVIVACSPDSAAAVRAALPRKFKVIEDEFLGAGHLGGLHSGLKAASNPWVALAPSEAPLSSPRLYELLLKAAKGHEGAAPLQSGKTEPMHGVYRKRELLKAVEAEMLHGSGGLTEAVRTMKLKELGPRKVESADKEKRTFWRLESAEAIRAVEGILK